MSRIEDVVANLNVQFSVLIEKKPIKESYMDIINTNPYALMAKSTYDLNPTPFEDAKEKEYDPESPLQDELSDKDEDESDDGIKEHLIKFPSHSEFVMKFRNARIAANRWNKRTYVCWRGYRTSMSPLAAPLKFDSFKVQVLTALKQIKKITPEEKKVLRFFKFKLAENLYKFFSEIFFFGRCLQTDFFDVDYIFIIIIILQFLDENKSNSGFKPPRRMALPYMERIRKIKQEKLDGENPKQAGKMDENKKDFSNSDSFSGSDNESCSILSRKPVSGNSGRKKKSKSFVFTESESNSDSNHSYLSS